MDVDPARQGNGMCRSPVSVRSMTGSCRPEWLCRRSVHTRFILDPVQGIHAMGRKHGCSAGSSRCLCRRQCAVSNLACYQSYGAAYNSMLDTTMQSTARHGSTPGQLDGERSSGADCAGSLIVGGAFFSVILLPATSPQCLFPVPQLPEPPLAVPRRI